MPMVANVPITVEITLADTARISVYFKADSRLSAWLLPENSDAYESNVKPFLKLKLLVPEKLNTIIRNIGRYISASTSPK